LSEKADILIQRSPMWASKWSSLIVDPNLMTSVMTSWSFPWHN